MIKRRSNTTKEHTKLGVSVDIVITILLPPLMNSLQNLVGIVILHELLLSFELHLVSLVMVGVPLPRQLLVPRPLPNLLELCTPLQPQRIVGVVFPLIGKIIQA